MTVSPLTRVERLYLNVALAFAIRHLGKRRLHSIPIDEFKDIVDYQYGGYRELKRSFASLRKKEIQFGSLSDDREPWACVGWFAEVQIRDGLIVYEFSSSMEQVLAESAIQFTKLDLMMLARLEGHNAMALYEVCKRFARVHTTAYRSIEWWHLALVARPLPERFQFKTFNRDVLKPAIAEINAKTDIHIEMETRGRPVATMRFKIQPNTRQVAPTPDTAERLEASGDPERRNQLLDTLVREFGIWEADVETLMQKPLDLLEEGVHYIRQRISEGKVTSNPGAYARQTLLNYSPRKDPAVTQLDQRKEAIRQAGAAQAEKRAQQQTAARYKQWRFEQVQHHLAQLPAARYQAIEAAFVAWLEAKEDCAGLAQYRKKGLQFERPNSVSSLFISFAQDADEIPLPSQAEFLEALEA